MLVTLGTKCHIYTIKPEKISKTNPSFMEIMEKLENLLKP